MSSELTFQTVMHSSYFIALIVSEEYEVSDTPKHDAELLDWCNLDQANPCNLCEEHLGIENQPD